jgi:hypothetical protein
MLTGLFSYYVHERTLTVHERTQKTVGSVFKKPYFSAYQLFMFFGTPFDIFCKNKESFHKVLFQCFR